MRNVKTLVNLTENIPDTQDGRSDTYPRERKPSNNNVVAPQQPKAADGERRMKELKTDFSLHCVL